MSGVSLTAGGGGFSFYWDLGDKMDKEIMQNNNDKKII